MRPIIKWAGGKTRMVGHIVGKIPNNTYNTYFEPFVGGGAVFLELLKQNRFKNAVLGDENDELITTYKEVRDNVHNLIKELKNGYYVYDKTRYLEVRAKDITMLFPVEIAARFIYLNKTCFNGLFRVNKSGKFNTPFGKYTNPLICDETALNDMASALNGVKLISADFEDVLEGARKNDLVYLDPPYLPLSKTSKFTSYGKNGFSEEDHYRLRGCFGKLSRIGVKTVLSNSSAPLIYKLYDQFEITELEGNRCIGGPAAYRNPVKELMITTI